MWKEFKEFTIKGNALDLAIGVIIGAAFTGIINSLVKDLITPPLGLITGGLDFTNKFFVLKAAKDGSASFPTLEAATKAGAVTWNYGNFITLVINFAIVAFAIFMFIRAINKMKRPKPGAPPVAKDCPACTMSIPINATRCPHCTSELAGAARA
ncbi:MAG TPA: large conductance mechanosensitive channel protein MscL [Chthoniobacterales bacterium]|jgi:large conductance mechanosensitive channel